MAVCRCASAQRRCTTVRSVTTSSSSIRVSPWSFVASRRRSGRRGPASYRRITKKKERNRGRPDTTGVGCRLRSNCMTHVASADLGFLEGEPERAKRASIEGVWAYGRMKLPGFGSRMGTKRYRNNCKSHTHNNNMKLAAAPGGVTSHPSRPL